MNHDTTAGTPEGNTSSGTPQNNAQPTHDFTLQIVMELQKSTGELSANVKALKDCIDKQDAKLDKIEGSLSSISHKVYASLIVAGIFLAIGSWFIDKAWDRVSPQLTVSTSTTTPAPQKKP